MLLTPVVSVVLLPSTTAVLALAVGSPVGHAAQLVALGEGRIGDAVQRGVAGDGGAPAIAGGAVLDEGNPVDVLRHDDLIHGGDLEMGYGRFGGGCAGSRKVGRSSWRPLVDDFRSSQFFWWGELCGAGAGSRASESAFLRTCAPSCAPCCGVRPQRVCAWWQPAAAARCLHSSISRFPVNTISYDGIHGFYSSNIHLYVAFS